LNEDIKSLVPEELRNQKAAQTSVPPAFDGSTSSADEPKALVLETKESDSKTAGMYRSVLDGEKLDNLIDAAISKGVCALTRKQTL